MFDFTVNWALHTEMAHELREAVRQLESLLREHLIVAICVLIALAAFKSAWDRL